MKLTSVKGFHDILPEESAQRARIEEIARSIFAAYGYGEIRVPIVERTELFRRGIGETTDIVEKEMYTFADRDETSLSLRPEGTASVVRAFVQHSLHQQAGFVKLFYIGPMFRRERPQKGRSRQFWQIGVEAIGRDDPGIDAETILLMHDLLAAIGVRAPRIGLNSLGCADCRPGYVALLADHGRARLECLCENCRSRVDRNPLRLLDCKVESCGAAMAEAPLMVDHLCPACSTHFGRVRAALDHEHVPYDLQPRMVRGLDYYCRTAFEATAEGLGSQNAVGGGGRYDKLVKAFGGPDAPGVGFALGVERLVLSLGEPFAIRSNPEVFLAPVGAVGEIGAIGMAHSLRRDGLRVEVGSGDKSLKSQMRLADKLGATHVLIVGEEELAAGALTVRDMIAQRDHARAVSFPCTAAELRGTLERLSASEVGRNQ
jgi:histidyl-tRNA synthetase